MMCVPVVNTAWFIKAAADASAFQSILSTPMTKSALYAKCVSQSADDNPDKKEELPEDSCRKKKIRKVEASAAAKAAPPSSRRLVKKAAAKTIKRRQAPKSLPGGIVIRAASALKDGVITLEAKEADATIGLEDDDDLEDLEEDSDEGDSREVMWIDDTATFLSYKHHKSLPVLRDNVIRSAMVFAVKRSIVIDGTTYEKWTELRFQFFFVLNF